MRRPIILDLFCGAGGCAKGYQRAGFRVVGVDNRPQPHYCGDEFVLADALEFLYAFCALGYEFDAIHASPPCQGYSKLQAMHPRRQYPMLIEPVRALLIAMGKPWVIENVETAPLFGITLCGSMFGLGVARGYLRRHRLFECSFPILQPRCQHRGPAVGVYGHGGHSGKHRMLYRKEAAEAMRIDWMSRDEMCQAIPPTYTEYIGRWLRNILVDTTPKP